MLISRGSWVLAPSSQARKLRAAAGIEMRHLAAGVYPRIGAAGADEMGFGGHVTEGALGERLHPGRER